MDTWTLEQHGFDPERAVAKGNRFLVANGYMGMRGTPLEATRANCPAVNLAGVYDKNGDKWREPVNAPRPRLFSLRFQGKEYVGTTPNGHTLRLDYRHGVFCRETDFGPFLLKEERIASLSEPHLLAERLSFAFREAGEAAVTLGISADIWDINGPHLFHFQHRAGETLLSRAVTGEKGLPVAAAMAIDWGGPGERVPQMTPEGPVCTLRFFAQADQGASAALFFTLFTGLDVSAPDEAALALCAKEKERGLDGCFRDNGNAWEAVWARCQADLSGSDEGALALHASQYYLNSIAPRHAENLSIPARGLSGQTYKGAVFWDSEIFLFPQFVYTQPQVAKSLLRYRIETLPGALKKAAEYGFRGAFYPWESQEGGQEGCTDFNVVDVFTHRPVRTYFRDKQIHISADIAYALWQYFDITGDRSLLEEGGAEVILQCARFYVSRMSGHPDRQELELMDVIGPDEYHERVANNAFTNRMARRCLENALALEAVFSDRPGYMQDLLQKLDYQEDWVRLPDAHRRLRLPRTRDGVLEQFDGYFALEDCSLDTVRSRLKDPREYWGGDHGVAGPTQIIKQADVIALMALLPEDFSDEAVAKNFAYYEPRTEHGSSLSACMYALTACRIGALDKAWELFVKTASIDLVGGGKQWAGEVYIGGTHPAANGGAWMIAVLGFAGLRMRGGKMTLSPRLPSQVRQLTFTVTDETGPRRITVTHDGWTAEPLGR